MFPHEFGRRRLSSSERVGTGGRQAQCLLQVFADLRRYRRAAGFDHAEMRAGNPADLKIAQVLAPDLLGCSRLQIGDFAGLHENDLSRIARRAVGLAGIECRHMNPARRRAPPLGNDRRQREQFYAARRQILLEAPEATNGFARRL